MEEAQAGCNLGLLGCLGVLSGLKSQPQSTLIHAYAGSTLEGPGRAGHFLNLRFLAVIRIFYYQILEIRPESWAGCFARIHVCREPLQDHRTHFGE